MSRDRVNILHLSDLHMQAATGPDAPVPRALLLALRAGRPWDLDLVVVTGDVLDSGDTDVEAAVRAVVHFRERLLDALDRDVPLVLLPGNHDRRGSGIFGPQRNRMFQAVRDALAGLPVWVSGCALPQLGEGPPPKLLGELPFHLYTYDSTYLGRGKMSAGGTLRAEDLLQIAGWLDGNPVPGEAAPLVLLMHHHLVPTPVTDTTVAGQGAPAPPIERLLLHQVAPRLIAHGDREELFMTALGSGTALTLLHGLGRPVVVLHGHKHCPTARLVVSPEEGGGDVLLVAAGSAGMAELFSTEGSDEERPMTLWPSWNEVRFAAGAIEVDVVAFDPEAADPAVADAEITVRRPLVRARQAGRRWELAPIAPRQVAREGRSWGLCRARYQLQPSQLPHRWNYTCEQAVQPAPDREPPRPYREPIFVRPGALLRREDGVLSAVASFPGQVTYRVLGGLFRSAEEARRAVGPDEAFGHVELIVRHHSLAAELSLEVPEGVSIAPFGSVMDLTSGKLSPAPLRREGRTWTLRCDAVPARTLLRIHWPLSEHDPAQGQWAGPPLL